MRVAIAAAVIYLATAAAEPVAIAPTVDTTYGHRETAQWYAVSLKVNSGQVLNVSLSTTLSRSWFPGSQVCESDKNKTGCIDTRGGVFDSSSGFKTEEKSSKFEDDIHNGVGASAVWLNGSGMAGTADKLTLSPYTSSKEIVLSDYQLGVFTSPKDAPNINGYLSLHETALALHESGTTDSASLHLVAEYGVDTARAEPLLVIFGGYDEKLLDLNKTQRWSLSGSTDEPRMEVKLEELVFKGKDMDVDILDEAATAVVDTTTPYLWLPEKAFQKLVDSSGAKWNASLNSYVFHRCGQDCDSAEENAGYAFMDFKISKQTISLNFGWFFQLETGLWDSFSEIDLKVLPVRPLKGIQDKVVLGRAAMVGIHVWVDYDERYFGLVEAAVNSTDPLRYVAERNIVEWNSKDHPPITGASILSVSPLPSSSSTPDTGASSTPSPSPSPSSHSKDAGDKPTNTAIIGAVVGGGSGFLVLASLGVWCFIRRRHSKPNTRTSAISGPYQLHGDSDQAKLVAEMGVPAGTDPVEAGDTSIGMAYYKLSELPPAHYSNSEKARQLPRTFPPHPALGGGTGTKIAREPVYEM